MAGSVNKVTLVGNLGADPEVRNLNDGGIIVNFRIATSETWKDKNTGERKEKTEWHRIVIFNEQLGKIASDYLKKGSKVYLEGALRTRSWTKQSGEKAYTTEVVLERFRGELTMLGGGSPDGESADQRNENQYGDPAPDTMSPEQATACGYTNGAANGTLPDLDDEIPF